MDTKATTTGAATTADLVIANRNATHSADNLETPTSIIVVPTTNRVDEAKFRNVSAHAPTVMTVMKKNNCEDPRKSLSAAKDVKAGEQRQQQQQQQQQPAKLDTCCEFLSKKFQPWIKELKFNSFLYTFVLYLCLPIWIWLSIFALVGNDGSPGGSVFVLVILAVGGRIIGSILEKIHLPPMIGMLGLGLVLRNVPYIDVGTHLNMIWSAPIRQAALAIILTRAGLGLDSKVLMKSRAVILRFAFFPTLVEIITVGILAYFFLRLPWNWAFLLGCVLAPVSPAVVVPRLLELKQSGHGMAKGIPTIIIASASLDNVIAISIFGVILNFVIGSGSLAFSIGQAPLQVIIGVAFGLCWGFFLGVLFNEGQKSNTNALVFRLLFTMGGGLISVIGLSKLGFSGAGALGCLLSAFVAASIWRIREVAPSPDPISTIYLMLWKVFEPLLFGVIGCQIDILSLDPNTIALGFGTIISALSVRLVVVFLMVSNAKLTFYEKLFCCVAWTPKATVQAAIGPIALEIVKELGGRYVEQEYGQIILSLAVLSILVTAPIGELGVMLTGTRFLTKEEPETEEAGGGADGDGEGVINGGQQLPK